MTKEDTIENEIAKILYRHYEDFKGDDLSRVIESLSQYVIKSRIEELEKFPPSIDTYLTRWTERIAQLKKELD